MDFNYSKLKGRITEKYGTQGKFAEALGINQITVSRKLNAETSFSRDDIIVWSNALDINRDDIGDYFFA